jgi:lipoprotein signal peptidase
MTMPLVYARAARRLHAPEPRWIPETTRFPALLVTGAVGVLALGSVLLRARAKAGLPVLALLLVTAGAVGNYLDRIFRGYVVDFVQLKHWPVFNVADAYVTLGFGVLAWAWFGPKARRRAEFRRFE